MSDLPEWKKLRSEQILSHPRLNVYEDGVVLPDGTKTTYIHFGEANGAVTAIVMRSDGRILLQKEYSYPSNEWLYQFPGGGLEKGETPLQGMRRELSEEANLSGDLEQIGWFYPDNRRRKDKMYIFIASNITDSPGKRDQEEEFIDYWVKPMEIKRLIAENQIVNYSTLAAWAIYSSRSEA